MKNPNPNYVTDELWSFWLAFQQIEPKVEFGGIYADKPGYHNTRNGNFSSNYSVRLPLDKQGPADKAAAIDLTFPDAQRGDYRLINKYSQRLLNSGRDKSDPRGNYLREFYGQTDKDSEVEGWDFQRDGYASSDKSHLWHIHISFMRAYVNSAIAMRAILSILKGETVDQWRKGGGHQLVGIRVLKLADPYMEGEDVEYVQKKVRTEVDGVFGPETERRVKQWQTRAKLSRDGVVDGVDWAVMDTPGAQVLIKQPDKPEIWLSFISNTKRVRFHVIEPKDVIHWKDQGIRQVNVPDVSIYGEIVE